MSLSEWLYTAFLIASNFAGNKSAEISKAVTFLACVSKYVCPSGTKLYLARSISASTFAF
jgi:hypothetical protein